MTGGIVADATGERGLVDVAIDATTVLEVGEDLRSTYRAEKHIDALGRWVLPGVVDPHVHLSSWFGCSHGHRALVAAGVTTAVDLAGPVEDIVGTAARSGAGLELGVVEALLPERLGGGVRSAMDSALDKGALGVKILGGHFPLTPDQVREVGEVTAERRDLVFAFHAGTTEHPGDFSGLAEAVTILAGLPVYLAHLNSYCRGEVESELVETDQALRWVEEGGFQTESYLGIINGCPGEARGGVLLSAATRRHLVRSGLAGDAEGLRRALSSGLALAVDPSAPEQLVSGEAAVGYWEAADSKITICFPVNRLSVGAALLTARCREDARQFAVMNLCSDGGGIPRNVTLEYGLRLVSWRVLTIGDLVTKYAKNPGKLLGMEKGSLQPGADADVVVVDPVNGRVDVTVGGGEILYEHGHVRGSGARWLSRGRGPVSAEGGSIRHVDVSRSSVFKGRAVPTQGEG
ncbi:MAG: amidohydrolase family protein [Acidimicrobiales bacterium]